MSFIDMTRVIPGEGSKTAPICLIGEAGGSEENRQLRPFVGPAGTVLEACLHAAGLMRSDCYITNVVKLQPRSNDISPFFQENQQGRWWFTELGQRAVAELHEELQSVRSNVLVPLGKTAMAAVTGHSRISKYRGYVMQAVPALGGRKVIPAIHPAASLRGQYILRYYITADLKKAKVESAFPEIRRPERRIIIPQTVAECHQWTEFLLECPSWACDIEVVHYQVSAIAFAPKADLSISFPMYGHWSLEEECFLWRMLNRLLTCERITKIFQNGIFDMGFLATQCGIHVVGPIEDTMVAHHIMYPEMLKSLEFLVSMYCGAQQYYKDMVKFDNIKKEA